jgi:predicted dienelactone hydrolase
VTRRAGVGRLVLLVTLSAACRRPAPQPPVTPPAGANPASAVAPRSPVGITTRVYDDRTRDRRLAVTIWYPARPGAVEETTNFDGIFPGRGAWEAPLRSAPSRMPLVLLSHGSGGDGPNLAWLAEGLAAQGSIAAAVDHPGDRFGDTSPEGRFAVWRRAPDLTLALTGLLADRMLGPRIDRRRIAAAGHSSGGLTVLLLAGARLRPADFVAACLTPSAGPDCAFIAELDVPAIRDLGEAGSAYRDRRIRAVVALAPVLALAATTSSLRAVNIPVEIIASPSDTLVPFAQNAARYARDIPRAQLTTVPGTGHFVFMPVCTFPGRLVAAAVCVDDAAAPDRAAVHAETTAAVTSFLADVFGGQGARGRRRERSSIP